MTVSPTGTNLHAITFRHRPGWDGPRPSQGIGRKDDRDWVPRLCHWRVERGEPRELTREIVLSTLEHLPSDRPRYLMGVGTPEEIAIMQVRRGHDGLRPSHARRPARAFFTSEGRFRSSRRVTRRTRAARSQLRCRVCQRYSRGYLRHLYASNELLAQVFNTVHNLSYYLATMKTVRAWIRAGVGIWKRFAYVNSTYRP